MRFISRLVGGLIVALLVIVAGAAVWLAVAPPALLRVGDGYAAKIVCSNVFIAGRDADTVLAEDVQAPGNPALKLIRVSVDREGGVVTARILGLFAPNYAVYRGALGCVSAPDGDLREARSSAMLEDSPVAASNAPWPDGNNVDTDAGAPLSAALKNGELAGPGMRAIVVVKDGRIVGEAYGDGFKTTTPLIGWSMTKTVNAAIIGRLMLAGRMSFDDHDLLPQWRGDARAAITLSDLLSMESGLAFNEDYGSVTDVTRMLYLTPDMASLAAAARLAYQPGTHFSYSTGTALILSRIWMDRVPNTNAVVDYPRDALFSPLGMTSAVLETDEKGTFVGGSYLYATARDWARFGQFLLQDGVWNGQRLLPEGFVGAMRTPSAASKGGYGQVQAWLTGPGGSNAAFDLPSDTFWIVGHDGQTIAIVPSANLVLVRMGLTPSWLHYRPQRLLKAVLDATASGRA